MSRLSTFCHEQTGPNLVHWQIVQVLSWTNGPSLVMNRLSRSCYKQIAHALSWTDDLNHDHEEVFQFLSMDWSFKICHQHIVEVFLLTGCESHPCWEPRIVGEVQRKKTEASSTPEAEQPVTTATTGGHSPQHWTCPDHQHSAFGECPESWDLHRGKHDFRRQYANRNICDIYSFPFQLQ